MYSLIFGPLRCGPCRREIPNIKKVYAEFKDKGLQVVGVSIDNSDKAWKALEKERIWIIYLYDRKGLLLSYIIIMEFLLLY